MKRLLPLVLLLTQTPGTAKPGFEVASMIRTD
jgi:hypothetical protein